MKPPGHVIISLSIGGVLWAITKSPYALVASFLTGVMIDLDHLVEYYRWFVKEDNTRVFFFFHSYELLVPSLLAGYFSGWDPVVLGVSAGYLGHLLTDQFANPVRPWAYFFTYRARMGFRRDKIINAEWDDLQREFLRASPVRHVLGLFNPKLKIKR